MSAPATHISAGKAMLDADVAVLDPAERLKSLAKGDDAGEHFGIVLGKSMQEGDAARARPAARVPRAATLPRRRAA